MHLSCTVQTLWQFQVIIEATVPIQWSRNEFHVGGAIFIFLVVYNFSANKACRRCFLLPSTKIAIQV